MTDCIIVRSKALELCERYQHSSSQLIWIGGTLWDFTFGIILGGWKVQGAVGRHYTRAV